jgi:D-tyrosyl-tRNA(Tyr) deacylase
MKAVIQRVSHASVTVNNEVISQINQGMVILLGVTDTDRDKDINWLSKKIAQLRIFNDERDVMNKSLQDIAGEAIVISQFTLMANTKKGNRPSYIKAARPDVAIPLYEKFISVFEQQLGKKVGTGIFGADMKVDLRNDGPVTIVIDTEHK